MEAHGLSRDRGLRDEYEYEAYEYDEYAFSRQRGMHERYIWHGKHYMGAKNRRIDRSRLWKDGRWEPRAAGHVGVEPFPQDGCAVD